MPSRLELHDELKTFVPNVYFQPPSGFTMLYPCIVYNKTGKIRHFAADVIYLSQQEYSIMVIDKNPDSEVADSIERHFKHCGIEQYYTVDNLNHTTLKLYY
jgi:hypothetical protein